MLSSFTRFTSPNSFVQCKTWSRKEIRRQFRGRFFFQGWYVAFLPRVLGKLTLHSGKLSPFPPILLESKKSSGVKIKVWRAEKGFKQWLRTSFPHSSCSFPFEVSWSWHSERGGKTSDLGRKKVGSTRDSVDEPKMKPWVWNGLGLVGMLFTMGRAH